MTKIQEVQTILGVVADGEWGPKSQAALDAAKPRPLPPGEWHNVKASSFADAADVAGYKRAKAKGMSDVEAFAHGDNGVGCWGDDCADGPPMCALPPDDMEARFGSVAAAKHAKVLVRVGQKDITCMLGDRMPWKRNIKNGCGIDLNPAACAALGLKPPMTTTAAWNWA